MLIAVDLNDGGWRWQKRCGADIGLNPGKVDVVDGGAQADRRLWLRRLHRGDRPSAGGDRTGCSMIRKLGTFVEFSVMREPVTVDWTIIGDTKELNIHGAHLGRTAIRWRSG